MRLVLSPRAESDLDDIAAYLCARNPSAAGHVEDALQAALQRLVDHPRAGPTIGRGLRRLVVPRLPYLIVYRIDEAADRIFVVTIRHAARQELA